MKGTDVQVDKEIDGVDDRGEYHYEGDTKENEEGIQIRHGFGLCKWSNGNEYEGDWKNNLMHGDGAFTELDGRYFNATFKKGKVQGDFEYVDEKADVQKQQKVWLEKEQDEKRYLERKLSKRSRNQPRPDNKLMDEQKAVEAKATLEF